MTLGAGTDGGADATARFRQLQSRSIGMGIAEGRGGYPGGVAPGWAEYVADQRAQLAAFDALVATHGPAEAGVADYFASLRQSLPADVRLTRVGEAAHVERIAGRAFFTLAASAGSGPRGYTFPLRPAACDALCRDPTLRARLDSATRAAIRAHEAAGRPRFSELDFAALLARLLPGEPSAPAPVGGGR